MIEEWRDIEGYKGYQVSNKGRVRSHGKITETKLHGRRKWADRILKPKVAKDKCSRVELWNDGKHKTLLVHRLEAIAFLGEAPKGMTVNHKDGNRQNNSIDNLEWCSRADNIRYGFEHDQYHMKHCTLIDKNGNEKYFRSMSLASVYLGRCEGYVSLCIKLGRKIRSVEGEIFDAKIRAV